MGRCDESAKVTVPRQRIAIIGSGIAGQTAAHFLSRRHEVVSIYEASPRPGLHTHSVVLEGYGPVDVPLRAYSPHYYPNLTQLYRYLGVSGQSVNYSSTGVDYGTQQSYFRYYNLLLLRRAIPFLWGRQLSSLHPIATLRIVLDLLWLVFTGPFVLLRSRQSRLKGRTLGEFLRQENYSYEFTHYFLYPVMSTLLSCSYAQVDGYPAELILQFYSSRSTTIFTGWSKVPDGVARVSEKLLQPIGPGVLLLDTKVAAVTCLAPGDPRGRVAVTTADGKTDYFDQVVIATEPGVASRLWKGTTKEEKQVLEAMDSFVADIVLHTDPSLMPASRATWSGMNYYSFPNGGNGGSHADAKRLQASMTSVWVNRYVTRKTPQTVNESLPLPPVQRTTSPGPRRKGQPHSALDAGGAEATGDSPGIPGDVFETWNPYHLPAEDMVISRATMARAVWTVAALRTYRELFGAVQGARGVWLCGSYCSPGVTLLEQAVTSALEVALDLGVADLPFHLAPCYEPRWWSLILARLLVSWRRLVVALVVVAVVALALSSLRG